MPALAIASSTCCRNVSIESLLVPELALVPLVEEEESDELESEVLPVLDALAVLDVLVDEPLVTLARSVSTVDRSPDSIAVSSAESSLSKLLDVEEIELGAGAASNVVKAVWASVMLPEDSADSTLVKKVPSGSVPLVELGVSLSMVLISWSAAVISPFLISDSRVESEVLKASVVDAVVELEVVEVSVELVRESPR